MEFEREIEGKKGKKRPRVKREWKEERKIDAVDKKGERNRKKEVNLEKKGKGIKSEEERIKWRK